MIPAYAELHAHSAFSFLDGASQPEELATVAAELGLSALALTDHDGLYGVVRFAQAAAAAGIATVYGAELSLDPHTHLLALARGPEGYRRLSRAIARAHLAGGAKGEISYDLNELADLSAGNWLILTGCRKGSVRQALEPRPGEFDMATARYELDRLSDLFGADNLAVEITNNGNPLDSQRCQALAELAHEAHLPLAATTGAHAAAPSHQQLADVLAVLKRRSTLTASAGFLPAGTAYLRSPSEMLVRHPHHRQAVATSAALARECAFDLDLLTPRLPPYPVPEGHTEATWLRELTMQGAEQRYGPPTHPSPVDAYDVLERELEIICALDFPGYFLIVHEIVQFCHDQGILCQGRGSAANSAVCFALGITAVDAVRHKMLFERFLSPGRSGPPDIDLDIESRRREEVIQHVYRRYGRTRAAQVANVISYRPRSAIRDSARAFGHEVGQQDAWSKSVERWGSISAADTQAPAEVTRIAQQLLTLPRHLGIHSGGMVLCDRPVIDVCPVEWARMPGRTVLQWDKDDCADAGLVKFDLLGLGMLTALRLAFAHIEEAEGKRLELHNLPQEDEAVYDLLCAADTVGVFQVESRAQMATLPRLRPRTFYDIVVEVALIRPGPIQGDAVHPYINRRLGREKVTYLHPLLQPALEKTLGVPLFQEQLMQIAIDTASFSASEADQLRRAMGSKRSIERMNALHDRLIAGMAQNGISNEVGEQIFDKLKAFADFGFPESHAFSFAYLVYASAWLKVHHPHAFYAGLLGAQPMGFYSPQSLIADARRHGIRVLRADVATAEVHASVCRDQDGIQALKLGLAPLRGIGEKAAERIVHERGKGPFVDIGDLSRRVGLTRSQLEVLASAGALAPLGYGRREGLWVAGALAGERGKRTGNWVQEPLPLSAPGLSAPKLPPMDIVSQAVSDVWASGISTDSHPMQFHREPLARDGIVTIAELADIEPGSRVWVAGIVTHRQRPATASGVTFLSLEDESGILNVIVSVGLWQRHRKVMRTSAALKMRGILERADGVINLMADQARPLNLKVPSKSRDFR